LIFLDSKKVIKSFYAEVYFERNGKVMSEETLTLYWAITNGLNPLGGMIGGLSSGKAIIS
jgi:hypothetical protein